MTADNTAGGWNGSGGRAPRILLFTGDGKGKTTAALGIALRASGHGLQTLIVQFIKAHAATGELAALRMLAGVEVRQAGLGFVPRSDDAPQFAAHRHAAAEGLRAAAAELASGRYRVVILDEVCTAVARGLLDEDSVVAALSQAPADGVIVLTGRGATPGLIARADTVTEMRCIKHGFDAGLPAQPGVEC
ncbi:MAG: cob(I)yrinic acid a,c-diamide adenosyltransferase [Lentisphaerae bacterium]|nr:cob(I)yrinic acid a,c-diamide adenosyltransferase [Lentisphaerota bacterium]